MQIEVVLRNSLQSTTHPNLFHVSFKKIFIHFFGELIKRLCSFMAVLRTMTTVLNIQALKKKKDRHRKIRAVKNLKRK